MDATDAAPQAEPAVEAEPDGSVPVDESPEDAQKRLFREALEAKRGGGGQSGSGGPGESKIHGTHGKAGNKRQFRRKSGG